MRWLMTPVRWADAYTDRLREHAPGRSGWMFSRHVAAANVVVCAAVAFVGVVAMIDAQWFGIPLLLLGGVVGAYWVRVAVRAFRGDFDDPGR